MTYPGLGGQQPPPQNSAPSGQLTPGVTPGVSGQVVASRVIIIGTGGELLVYSPAAGAGNLIASVAGSAGTDQYGNAEQVAITSYVTGNTGGYSQLAGGAVNVNAAGAASPVVLNSTTPGVGILFSGTVAGGDSEAAIEVASADANGGTSLIALSAGQCELPPVIDGMSVTGGLTVDTINGSANTGSAGLPNGGIAGTSGAASAGTAHTHGPGTFAVTNGVHVHTI